MQVKNKAASDKPAICWQKLPVTTKTGRTNELGNNETPRQPIMGLSEMIT